MDINKKSKVLVIVESPTKIRTLSKFLGSNYKVVSSKGHLIDLPKSQMGIDIENNFEPKYITIRGKGKILSELKRDAKKVDLVLLATDPDREGEAISWHLARVLSGIVDCILRIEFNEITEVAILNAIKNTREIDTLKVNSQQARRILDRLVGYSVSPLLQEKFSSKRFSAGRVQSACLHIIAKREKQVCNFVSQEYWEVFSTWNYQDKATSVKDGNVDFQLSTYNNNKIVISNEKELNQVLGDIKGLEFFVSKNISKNRNVNPSAPYTTSKLQQEASTRLSFRPKKTMMVAQSLYEGISISGKEVTGLITYMRTDSTRVSQGALDMVRSYITREFSKDYLPDTPNTYFKKKKLTQDAHEAIRPTSVDRTPEKMASSLNADQLKLYRLIWNKFVASQMTAAIDEQVSIRIQNENSNALYVFNFSSSKVYFDGFRKISGSLKKEEKSKYIPSFKELDKVKINNLENLQKFTQPPPRFTEASLIKEMEETGIGRPATYVPTISNLENRRYIERKGRQILLTEIGRVVNLQMEEYFGDIVDAQFTASMEEQLDSISDGTIDMPSMLGSFYSSFAPKLDYAREHMEDQSHLVTVLLGEDCPECSKELCKRLGKNGFFIACSGFKDGCRFTRSIPLGKCPKCVGQIVTKRSIKSSKSQRAFYGCDQYSVNQCNFIMYDKPSKRTCSACDSIMSEKVKKNELALLCQNASCKKEIIESVE